MLQRGLLTLSVEHTTPPYHVQHQQQPLEERMESGEEQQFQPPICLPMLEMPEIKIERADLELDSMEAVDEQQVEEEIILPQHQEDELREEEDPAEIKEPIIKPLPQLLEPTSILKTSLLTGAAATLATLTAAAEQIAKMPMTSTTTAKTAVNNTAFAKSTITTTSAATNTAKNLENKRVLFTTSSTMLMGSKSTSPSTLSSSPLTNATATTTYSSILQTALMSKRPLSSLNVATTAMSAPSSPPPPITLQQQHNTTPAHVLKTAVTLATLSEIAAEQDKQQQQQQQQCHIWLAPQRQMATLPFKKLNFANLTQTHNLTQTATTKTNASSNATETATVIKNLEHLASSSSSLNTYKSYTNDSSSSTSNRLVGNYSKPSQTIAQTQTSSTQIKIPTIRPNTVTIQTQTEDNHHNQLVVKETQTLATTPLSPSSQEKSTSTLVATCLNQLSSTSNIQTQQNCQTATALRTEVATSKKLIMPQHSSTTSASASTSASTSSTSTLNVIRMPTATNVVGKSTKVIVKETATLSTSHSNIVAQDNHHIPIHTNTAISTAATASSSNTPTSAASSNAVTVVVFETLLPED